MPMTTSQSPVAPLMSLEGTALAVAIVYPRLIPSKALAHYKPTVRTSQAAPRATAPTRIADARRRSNPLRVILCKIAVIARMRIRAVSICAPSPRRRLLHPDFAAHQVFENRQMGMPRPAHSPSRFRESRMIPALARRSPAWARVRHYGRRDASRCARMDCALASASSCASSGRSAVIENAVVAPKEKASRRSSSRAAERSFRAPPRSMSAASVASNAAIYAVASTPSRRDRAVNRPGRPSAARRRCPR